MVHEVKQACVWCSPEVGQSEGGADAQTVCGCCAEHFTLPPDGPLQRHLDGLAHPVLVIDLHAGTYLITRAVNRQACLWLNKAPEEIVQHLSGNVIGCVYARLAEGCGATIHCKDCTIKRAVAQTIETGEPQVKVPATLHQGDPACPSVLDLSLTALKSGKLVMLRVERGRGRHALNCPTAPGP